MKCNPAIKHPHKTVDFADLEVGKTFVYNGDLYIKCSHTDQIGVCLNDGTYLYDVCGSPVIPVNAEVSWSYKKKK